jgi:alpha-beta hydrolase superfamily lysophospholipase
VSSKGKGKKQLAWRSPAEPVIRAEADRALYEAFAETVVRVIKTKFRWLRKHYKLTGAMLLLVAFGLLNLLAYGHARAMTHFEVGGRRTGKPETLSLLQKVRVLFTGVRVTRPSNLRTPGDLGLAFQTHHIDSSKGQQLEAWYVPRLNSKRLVFLFHGYAVCKDRLLEEARVFHTLGYAALLVDFRGCGGSTGDYTTVGVEEADDVASVWAYARTHWPDQKIILYGRSMGSVAILRAVALEQVQPLAALLECPFDRLLSTVAKRFHAMGLPSFPGARLLVFWGGVQLGFDGFQHNPVDYARSVHCPVLVLHGDSDPRVTPEEVQEIFENLQGDKHFELLAGVGHESYVQSQPERWRAVVGAFLERLP